MTKSGANGALLLLAVLCSSLRALSCRQHFEEQTRILFLRKRQPEQMREGGRDIFRAAFVGIPARGDRVTHEDDRHVAIEVVRAAMARASGGGVHVDVTFEQNAQVRASRRKKRVLEQVHKGI